MANSQLIDDDENGNEEEQPPLQEEEEHWASVKVIRGKQGSGRGSGGNGDKRLHIHLITSALKKKMMPSFPHINQQ